MQPIIRDAERIISFPGDIRCGHCGKGFLRIANTDIEVIESRESIEAQGFNDWEYDWVHGSAIVKARCGHCENITILLAKYRLKEFWEEDPVENCEVRSYVDELSIEYAIPSPHFAGIHAEYPHRLRESLIESFAFYFKDRSACANKQRICVELILDTISAPAAKTTHERIELLSKSSDADHVKISRFLMAIKWIGNIGSHTDEEISEKVISDAYKMIDHSLDLIFIKTEAQLLKRAQEISSAKGHV